MVPVPALVRTGRLGRPDDHVTDARPDLLIAARTAIELNRRRAWHLPDHPVAVRPFLRLRRAEPDGRVCRRGLFCRCPVACGPPCAGVVAGRRKAAGLPRAHRPGAALVSRQASAGMLDQQRRRDERRVAVGRVHRGEHLGDPGQVRPRPASGSARAGNRSQASSPCPRRPGSRSRRRPSRRRPAGAGRAARRPAVLAGPPSGPRAGRAWRPAPAPTPSAEAEVSGLGTSSASLGVARCSPTASAARPAAIAGPSTPPSGPIATIARSVLCTVLRVTLIPAAASRLASSARRPAGGRRAARPGLRRRARSASRCREHGAGLRYQNLTRYAGGRSRRSP